MTELNKSGLLKSAIVKADNPRHVELPAGNGGATTFATDGKILGILTPPDPLIRVHEMMHTKHTVPGMWFGKHPFVRQIIEDCRLHEDHWPWPVGQTPETVVVPAFEQLAAEQATIDKAIAENPELPTEKRGKAFGISMRTAIAKRALDGKGFVLPGWLSHSEQRIADMMKDYIEAGNYDAAADVYEKTFFGPAPKEKEEDSGSAEGDDDGDDDTPVVSVSAEVRKEAARAKKEIEHRKSPHLHRKPRPTVCRINDKGPYFEPCGDPSEGWNLATTGARIHRPSLRKPVLPQRLFIKRKPVQPGGAIIIDASGSMNLTVDDILGIIDHCPLATVALYDGNDEWYAPVGDIFVVSKNGFRRERTDIEKYIRERKHGNSVDLEAINWLLEQSGPRTMVTDRGFTGSFDSVVALAKLEECERLGDIEVVLNGRSLLPPENPRYVPIEVEEAA